jgi:hypothetical protein
MPTAAEYISAFMVGGDQFHAMRAGIQAAAPDVLTSDIPGVLPLPIVQPVYNNFIGRRPVIDAIGAKSNATRRKSIYPPRGKQRIPQLATKQPKTAHLLKAPSLLQTTKLQKVPTVDM